MPQIRINQGLLESLAERWHSEHNTCHLPIGEMTVTPEDVWRILQIPIVGELVVYDSTEQGGTDALCQVFQNDTICGYKIPWQEMVDTYTTFPSILVDFIAGFLCPNHRSKGLLVERDHILESIITHGTRYAWGLCMLSHLHHDFHQVLYLRGASLSLGVTLIQVWTWEHIVVIHLVANRQ